MSLKFDLNCDNFLYFFEKEAALMTEAQKELLPKELLFRLYAKGGRVNVKETAKMGFLAKVFVLFKALKKRVIIIVEDDANGMDEEEYFKWKKLTSKQNYSQDNAGKLITEAQFVLGNKELCDTYGRLNYLSNSAAYNYLSKSKNKDSIKSDDYIRNQNYVCRFINHYDSQKKKIVMETGLTMAEWITLTYLYDGLEKLGKVLYTEKFKYSYNSSSTKIKVSFGTLQIKGFITKHGTGKGCKLQITALGRERVNSILHKYVTNC